MADFEQVENCISFAENEGYTEWAKGAEDELTLYRVRLSAAEQERDEYGSALRLLSEQAPLLEQDREVARQALSDVMRDRRAVGERLAAAEARAEAAERVLVKAERRSKVLLSANVGSEPSDYDRQVYFLAHEVIDARAALAGREETGGGGG